MGIVAAEVCLSRLEVTRQVAVTRNGEGQNNGGDGSRGLDIGGGMDSLVPLDLSRKP